LWGQTLCRLSTKTARTMNIRTRGLIAVQGGATNADH
jgi:hypothetical protein